MVKLPLATNRAAKMQVRDGFVKLFASRNSGMVLGGVVGSSDEGKRADPGRVAGAWSST